MRTRLLAAALLSGALLSGGQAAVAAAPGGFSFGLVGGNIRPYTVTVAPAGVVQALGATARVHVVPAAVRTRLLALAQTVGFAKLPASTLCPRTLPDVAARFIRIGVHRVQVHGDCVAGFSRLYAALSVAVGLPL